MPCKVTTSSLIVSGASLASALATLSEKLSLRRLPGITTTLWVDMISPFDAGTGPAGRYPNGANERCKCMDFSSVLSASSPGLSARKAHGKHQVADLANNGR